MIKNVCHPSEIDFDINSLEDRKEAGKILMCPPDYFQVVDQKNPFMDPENNVDAALAKEQWNELLSAFLSMKDAGALEDVRTLQAVEGLEDMVFAANQTFPWINKTVFISKMKHFSRQQEVESFKQFFENSGFRTISMPYGCGFEGMGDAIPLPGKNMIFGGYGFRSDTGSYIVINQFSGSPVILMKLVDPRFYHLDTCFLPISDRKLLLFPGAFEEDAAEGLKNHFEVIEVPENEALNFGLNGYVHCGEKKFAIIQKGNPFIVDQLESEGFNVIQIETSEFMKSGGSVFCMKVAYS